MAFRDVMDRAKLFTHHHISREPLSVRERMSHILSLVQGGPMRLEELVDPEEGRLGVVVCFLAILELTKSALLDVVQDSAFAPLMVQTAKARPSLEDDEDMEDMDEQADGEAAAGEDA
jgi:segregation and condensation protein A